LRVPDLYRGAVVVAIADLRVREGRHGFVEHHGVVVGPAAPDEQDGVEPAAPAGARGGRRPPRVSLWVKFSTQCVCQGAGTSSPLQSPYGWTPVNWSSGVAL